MCRIFVLLLLIINNIGLNYCITRNPVKFELLDNKFRLSIANDPDIKWVTYHVNINKEFNSFEAGELTGTAGMPRNQLWSFDFNRDLQDDDIVYVWIHIQQNHLGLRDIKDPISVAAFKSGKKDYYIKTSPTTTTTTETPIVDTKSTILTKSTKIPVTPGNENKNCEPTITQLQPPGSICKDEIIFEDNFETFNEELWTNEIRIPATNDIEFVLYNGTVDVKDGILRINASLSRRNIRRDTVDLGQRCTSNAIQTECIVHPKTNMYVPPINSGRISTKKSLNFKYGRVEVKAKLPIGDWLFPLISLEPSYKVYGDLYKSGEMRIAFARGNNESTWENKNIGGDRLYGGVFFSTNATVRHLFMSDISISEISKNDRHFGDNFHLYSLTWTPEELIMAVDDNEYGRIKANFSSNLFEATWYRGESNAPLDQFFYITLGLSAGGHGDFPEDHKPWNNTYPSALWKFNDGRQFWYPTWVQPQLQVEYVKVLAI